jgi:hypothetical protein
MTMPRARRQARLDPVVRPARDTAAGFGAVVPGGAELRGVAADLLHGLQYSFLAAAMHPDIRFPFGSLEEAFQGTIALRPAEQRWIYHVRARQFAGASPVARQAAFGRYGAFDVEEFGRVGLATVSEHLPALRLEPRRIRPGTFWGIHLPGGTEIPPAVGSALTTAALYITEVGCLDQAVPAVPRGEKVAIGGLAIDPAGGITQVDQFLVREDFETGMRKDYGIPGRKFCEFYVSQAPASRTLDCGVAAFLAAGDRAGFSQSLTGAWVKAGPIFRKALETGVAGAHEATIPQLVGQVIERFMRWLAEAFQDDVLPPGLEFARLESGSAVTGGPGQLTFAGERGRYRVDTRWRVAHG